MKTPEEIKDGLECCQLHDGDMYVDCSHCPYYLACTHCDIEMHKDALAYIQQLENHFREVEKKVQQFERERDALLEGLMGDCGICAHWQECVDNDFDLARNYNSCWQWRGVQEVE